MPKPETTTVLSRTDFENEDRKKARLKPTLSPVFSIAVALILLFVIVTALVPEAVGSAMTTAMDAVAANVGWAYLVVPFLCILLMVFLAVSRYGRIRLGSNDSRPEYSTYTWLTMIVAAVMGIGLVSYGVAEPISHFMNPPHGLAEPETMEAAVRALEFSYLDWGMHAWAIFGLFGLAIGYTTHRKGRTALVSDMLRPVLGDRVDGWLGKVIDVLTILATLFGTTTSLGLGGAQISQGLNTVLGIDANLFTQIMVIVVVTLLFTGSALSGVSRGIKYISHITLVLATLFGLYIFIMGPSAWLANIFVRSLGQYSADFFQISLLTPVTGDDLAWMQWWTYFMMAWWLSWSAFVGIFLAKISKGRTIREFVAGVLLVPSLVFFSWFTVMGGSAMKLDMDNNAGIGEATQNDLNAAFFALLDQFPLSGFTSVVAILMVALFFVSSADSNTFVLSSLSSHGTMFPTKTPILTWGVLTGASAIVLLIAGGLVALQQAAMLSALPFTVIVVVLAVALLKELRTEPHLVP